MKEWGIHGIKHFYHQYLLKQNRNQDPTSIDAVRYKLECTRLQNKDAHKKMKESSKQQNEQHRPELEGMECQMGLISQGQGVQAPNLPFELPQAQHDGLSILAHNPRSGEFLNSLLIVSMNRYESSIESKPP